MAKTKISNIAAPTIDKKWQAEDDLRTLINASEVRKDKARYKAAQMLAKEKLDEYGELASGTEDTVAEEQAEK